MADISVVIVTWNSERWIERCLASVPPACEDLSYEILLYDNASTDATVARVKEHGVRLIRSDANRGYAAATNEILGLCNGRYVFLLNPDCELDRGALRRLFDFLQGNPGIAAAAPLLVDESGTSQREFQLRRLPTLRTFLFEVLLLDKLMPRNGTTARFRYRDLDLSVPQRVEQPAAAALLVRRNVFDRLGRFDEQFSPAWFEDVDYCRRAAEEGLEMWVVPSAGARHFGGASLAHMPFADFIDIWYRHMWLYARKWLPPAHAAVLRGGIAAGMLLRMAVTAAGAPPNGAGTRSNAMKAYARVLRSALRRWSDSSPSSS